MHTITQTQLRLASAYLCYLQAQERIHKIPASLIEGADLPHGLPLSPQMKFKGTKNNGQDFAELMSGKGYTVEKLLGLGTFKSLIAAGIPIEAIIYHKAHPDRKITIGLESSDHDKRLQSDSQLQHYRERLYSKLPKGDFQESEDGAPLLKILVGRGFQSAQRELKGNIGVTCHVWGQCSDISERFNQFDAAVELALSGKAKLAPEWVLFPYQIFMAARVNLVGPYLTDCTLVPEVSDDPPDWEALTADMLAKKRPLLSGLW